MVSSVRICAQQSLLDVNFVETTDTLIQTANIILSGVLRLKTAVAYGCELNEDFVCLITCLLS
jgi:hypothetical protein